MGVSIGLGHPFFGLFCLQKLVQGKFNGGAHNTKAGGATTADAFTVTHGVGERQGRIEESGRSEGSTEERWKVVRADEFFVRCIVSGLGSGGVVVRV